MSGHGRTYSFDGDEAHGFELLTCECKDIESDYNNIKYFVDDYGVVYRHENDELVVIYKRVSERSGPASEIAIGPDNSVWIAINSAILTHGGIGCYRNNEYSRQFIDVLRISSCIFGCL